MARGQRATPPRATPLIEVRHLSKTYWNGFVAVHAVQNVHVTIHEGECIALMGPSGSGKSTLMNLLAFLDAPTSGSYTFCGENIQTFDEEYRARLRNATLGFVFQQFYLLSRTSALDNVRLPLLYAGVSSAEQKQRAYEALCKVGLEDRMYHVPNQLSGGQQQRVSIARALVNNPAVLFCDEPTGNLDSGTSQDIMRIFTNLHKEGKTIIIVTHDEHIAQHAQRIIHMKDGTITTR